MKPSRRAQEKISLRRWGGRGDAMPQDTRDGRGVTNLGWSSRKAGPEKEEERGAIEGGKASAGGTDAGSLGAKHRASDPRDIGLI